MNYIEIKFEEIKGYDKLSEVSKKFFKKVYKLHNSIIGLEYKNNWIPIKVIERTTYLKVYFKNGEYLNYYINGTWG